MGVHGRRHPSDPPPPRRAPRLMRAQRRTLTSAASRSRPCASEGGIYRRYRLRAGPRLARRQHGPRQPCQKEHARLSHARAHAQGAARLFADERGRGAETRSAGNLRPHPASSHRRNFQPHAYSGLALHEARHFYHASVAHKGDDPCEVVDQAATAPTPRPKCSTGWCSGPTGLGVPVDCARCDRGARNDAGGTWRRLALSAGLDWTATIKRSCSRSSHPRSSYPLSEPRAGPRREATMRSRRSGVRLVDDEPRPSSRHTRIRGRGRDACCSRVRDEVCPWNDGNGRSKRLKHSRRGQSPTRVSTSATSAASISAGSSFSQLLRAGKLQELRDGAVQRAERHVFPVRASTKVSRDLPEPPAAPL